MYLKTVCFLDEGNLNYVFKLRAEFVQKERLREKGCLDNKQFLVNFVPFLPGLDVPGTGCYI